MGCGDAGPSFELQYSLVEEHLDAENGCTAFGLCRFDELGFQGAVDHVEHDVFGAEELFGDGALLGIVRIHADRRSIDDNVMLVDFVFNIGGEVTAFDWAFAGVLEIVDECGDVVLGATENCDRLGGRTVCECECNGADCTARTEK